MSLYKVLMVGDVYKVKTDIISNNNIKIWKDEMLTITSINGVTTITTVSANLHYNTGTTEVLLDYHSITGDKFEKVSTSSAMAKPGENSLTPMTPYANTLNNIREMYEKDRYEPICPVIRQSTKCDCGGFKTYQTMDESAHSSWCSSRGKK